ncbi:hypothetical protein ACQPVP_12400 [Clostridium nigeriense]|uniref:hypothetical protein n=1 Tax=Clostridium nigeriense TaxID=1805470 RepID=UPI003D352EB2
MKNNKTLNVLGIIAVFVIIIGSWSLTKYMLYRKEEKLLSRVNKFDISINSDSENSNSNLTTEQIREVLVTWNDNKELRVHDPTINQLTMDEAVSRSIEDIKYFCDAGIIPTSIKSIDDSWNTYAYLGTKAPMYTYSKYIYSYWTIKFSNEDVNIEIKQNAYTGYIWNITIYDFINDNVESINIEEALKMYSNYLGIPMSNYSKSELGYGSLTSDDSKLILSYQSNTLVEKGNAKIEISLSPN